MKHSKSNRTIYAELVALLRDGPLTVAGAAEMAGTSHSVVLAFFRSLEVAEVAYVSSWRRNPMGQPSPVWEFATEPGMVSVAYVPVKQAREALAA